MKSLGALLENNDEATIELKNRIRTISDEIERGWTLYGRFIDRGTTNSPNAVEVKTIVESLLAERSRLEEAYFSKAVSSYIKTHGDSNGSVN